MLTDLGDEAGGVELYASANTMGVVANSRWFADIVGDEMAAIAAGLPVEGAEVAKGRPQDPISWEMAAELQAELEEMGWGAEIHRLRN